MATRLHTIIKLTLLFLALAGCVCAQPLPQFSSGAGNPSGTCSGPLAFYVDSTTGNWWTCDGGTWVQPHPVSHAVTFVLSNGGSVLSTGPIGSFWRTKFTGAIFAVDVQAAQSCSVTVDIWKANAAIPTSANKISASDPATLSSAQLSEDTLLTGWTTAVAVNDVFSANISSVTSCTQVTVEVWFQ